jgi:adenylate/guanylate cyclase family protein/TAP-like protein
VLPAIRVPTLILHNVGDRTVPVESSRYMAERIPGAKYVELAGVDHVPYSGNPDAILDEIEEFLTGVRHGPELDRVLATVLFTDIVDSTRKAAELGDRGWRGLLDAHHALVRERLVHFRGRQIDTAGDGFLAAFDGPARGVRAACAIAQDIRRLGLEVRAGLHTGECEVSGAKLTGIAVHIGARIAALARGGGGACLEHGQGSRGRLRAQVRRPRRPFAQGCARRVASLRSGPGRRPAVADPSDDARVIHPGSGHRADRSRAPTRWRWDRPDRARGVLHALAR